MASSPIVTALKGRCPKCREGKLFTHSAYSIHFYKVNTNCSSCGQRFEVEPGFFIGAMYVNYAFTVAQLLVVGFVVNYLKPNAVVWDFMLYTMSSVLIFLPLTFRLSKSLYLYWFSGVKYENLNS